MEKLKEPIEFTSKVTKNEVKVFYTHIVKKHKPLLFLRRVLRVLLLLLILIFGITSFIFKDNPLDFFSENPFYIIAVFAPLALYSHHLLIHLRTYLTIKSDKSIGLDNHYIITKTAIKSKTSLHESTLSWEIIYKVEETENLIILYVNKLTSIIISKNSATEEQLSKLRMIIAQQNLIYEPMKN